MSGGRRIGGSWLAAALLGALTVGVPAPAGAVPPTVTVHNTTLHGEGQVMVGGQLGIVAFEASSGSTDFNGDGDTADSVPHLFDPETAATTNTMLAGPAGSLAAAGLHLGFSVPESSQGATDLNGDGDSSDIVFHSFDPASGTATNSTLSASFAVAAGSRFAFFVVEGAQGGTDLNGDGDALDPVLHVFDPVTGTTTNSMLAGGFTSPVAVGDLVAFEVVEASQGGTDLNGDGDAADSVLHVFDPATSTATNTGLASGFITPASGWLAFSVSESAQGGTDLNGDGDALDMVGHLFDPASATAQNTALAGFFFTPVADGIAFEVAESSQGGTDLNGDGDALDGVIHFYSPITATSTNTALAGFVVAAVDGKVGIPVPEAAQGGTDLNGDGDANDQVIHVFDPGIGTATNTMAVGGFPMTAVGALLSFATLEGSAGTDLNGDGDQLDTVIRLYDPASATVLSSGLAYDSFLATHVPVAVGDFLVVGVSEAHQGNTDLNGNGNTSDGEVLHVYDPAVDESTNTMLASIGELTAGDDRTVSSRIREGSQGVDLNGDGDLLDEIVHVLEPGSGTPTNSAPTAVDDGPYGVAEGDTLAVGGVLDNDTDPDGDPLTAALETPPDHGILSLDPDGSFTYAHNGSETSSDSFTYTASDGSLQSGPATVTITITPVNDAPIAVDDGPFTVAEGDTLVVTQGVLDNDTDAEGDLLTALAMTEPAHGTLTLAAAGGFSYVHDGSETTSDGFTYRASDGAALSNVASVTITITPVDDPPPPSPPPPPVGNPETVGLHDPATGHWYLRNSLGAVTVFTYGNPSDQPFMGDWDCDGIDTPGLYRTAAGPAGPAGKVYLRNSNSTGLADVEYFFGDPGDIAVPGDWDGDGCDTVGLFRPHDGDADPSSGTLFVTDRLGSRNRGIGAAEVSFRFGDPEFPPFAGNFDADPADEPGYYLPASAGRSLNVFLFEGLSNGTPDRDFLYGNPGDAGLVGDWDGDGIDSVAVYRPAEVFGPAAATFYLRNTNTTGIADVVVAPFGDPAWTPLHGHFGLG